MTAAQLLATLNARGVTVEATPDGNLRCTPSDILTPADVDMIRAHKPALRALLAGEDDVPSSPCGCCWRPLVWTPDWPRPGEGRWLCAYCPTVDRPVFEVAPDVQAVIDGYYPPRRLAS